MKAPIPLLVLFLLAQFAFGEGLPLNKDRTRYEGDHFLVKLNEDQLEEVTVARTLTLTREQWKQAREFNSVIPKRVEYVLPSTHADCTCYLYNSTFGVWFKDGSVAIATHEASLPFAKLDKEKKNEVATNIHLYMDKRGQFYENGKLIPYAEVKARVAYECPKPDKKGHAYEPSVGIEIPPGSKAKDAALASRLMELKKLSKATGRNFYVLWDRTMLGE